ncbi:hypothetical protein [Acinetobacter puyangensis]|uniref:hypothetical protein n=1 Tax=Acinetobacter puyangensis TaxID=1096779 RepID=UPI003A4D782E
MQFSFNGGIISPEMFGRIDQAKYQTGLADCVNFYPELYGGLTYRAGFQFVYQYGLSVGRIRLIPFIFSEEQTVVLAIQQYKINFFADGAILLNDANTPLEIAVPYASEHLMQLRYAQSADVITITHPAYPPLKIIRKGATVWEKESITVGYGIDAPTNAAATAHIESKYQPGGDLHDSYVAREYLYQVTAVDEDNESKASNKTTMVENDLTLNGNYNTIIWDAVSGATRYRVFKLRSGLASYIGETTELSFTDDHIEADAAVTPPLIRDPFQYYPTAVAYHGQRKVYGGGYEAPQWIRMSRTATDDNFSYHIPLQDSDSIQIRFAARDGNGVKHIVPMGDLMILTGGAVWKLSADGAITATSINVHPQSYVGANDVTPIQLGGAALFASDQTGHVHEVSLAANAYNSSYQVIDLSVLCPNIFDGHKIIDSALIRNPMDMVYFVRDDGVLLSLTYDANQQVWAWAQHTTQGTFQSVAAIQEDSQTVLYAVIKRQTGVMIERLLMRQPINTADQCYLDSSMLYHGQPTKTISGLDWLEGQEVDIFADGGHKPPVVVQDGAITLDRELSNVRIGLRYTGEIQSLPLYSEQVSIVKPKAATKVHLRLLSSQAIFVGVNSGELTEYKPRSLENYGQPLELKTGFIEVPVAAQYGIDIQVNIKHDKPFPLRLLAMEVEFR